VPSAGGLRPYAGLVLIIVLARFAAFVSRMHIAPFYPELMRLYRTDYAGIGALFSSFFWGYAAVLWPAGWLADRISPRLQIGLGLALLGAGTALDGMVGSYTAAFVLRQFCASSPRRCHATPAAKWPA
jgi:MFS family permease